jgi:diguanylate cyclase (GGDEF)-like protein
MFTASPGASNRIRQSVFLDTLAEETAAQGAGDAHLGLLLVQLRGLEALNHTIGYRCCDLVLDEVSRMLEEAFGARARVVRIGTSRFAVLLRGLKSEAHAVLAATRVGRIAVEPLEIEGQRVDLSFNQSIALYPAHASAAEGLLQCAELALKLGIETGEAISIYRPDSTADVNERHRVEAGLVRALEQGGVETFFQPQIEIATGRTVGAEALLRCRDGNGAALPPEIVVAVAERTNRLAQLTSAVLHTGLRYAADWPVAGTLSVNISARSLKDPDLPALIADALEIWNREPAALTIEITETAFIEEPKKSLAAMRSLQARGVRVSIDDFGTGYSSLSYFTNIPASELKVDKSFVLAMLESDADRRIVQAVVNLAHGFDLAVVAEGVENRETLEALRRMGCDVAQGFLVGRPMAPAQYGEWLVSRAGGQIVLKTSFE